MILAALGSLPVIFYIFSFLIVGVILPLIGGAVSLFSGLFGKKKKTEPPPPPPPPKPEIPWVPIIVGGVGFMMLMMMMVAKK